MSHWFCLHNWVQCCLATDILQNIHCVWNDTSVGKWWKNVHFWINYTIKEAHLYLYFLVTHAHKAFCNKTNWILLNHFLSSLWPLSILNSFFKRAMKILFSMICPLWHSNTVQSTGERLEKTQFTYKERKKTAKSWKNEGSYRMINNSKQEKKREINAGITAPSQAGHKYLKERLSSSFPHMEF